MCTCSFFPFSLVKHGSWPQLLKYLKKTQMGFFVSHSDNDCVFSLFKLSCTLFTAFFPSFSLLFTVCEEAQFALITYLSSAFVVVAEAIWTFHTRWSATYSTALLTQRLILRRWWPRLIADGTLIYITVLENGHLGLVQRISFKIQIPGTGTNTTDTAGIRVVI